MKVGAAVWKKREGEVEVAWRGWGSEGCCDPAPSRSFEEEEGGH